MEKERKIVLITGCSSGFGKLMSSALLKEGYFVVATMRDINRKEGLLKEIDNTSLLKYLDVLELDVTDYKNKGIQLESILNKYPRIDIYINNAGVILSGMIEDLDISNIEYQFDINVVGSAWLINQISKKMIEQQNGKIIIMSSLAGRRSFPMQSMYHASKFALSGLAESLFLELAPYNIDVSLVEPGVYNTKIWNNAIIIKQDNPNEYKKSMYQYSQRFTKGKDPKEVINKVLKISDSKNPKLHYSFGIQNKLFILCKGVIYSRIGKLIYRRFFTNNEKN